MVSLNRNCEPPRFNDCSFLLSVVKQVSHIAVNFLDQSGRVKENFLDLKYRRRGVLELESGLYAVKRSLLVFEMGAKTSTAVVPYGLRSKRSSKNENY